MKFSFRVSTLRSFAHRRWEITLRGQSHKRAIGYWQKRALAYKNIVWASGPGSKLESVEKSF